MALRPFRRLPLPRAPSFQARQPSSTFSAVTNDAVRILEVAPRDGLQNIKTQVSTVIKTELIERLAATGLRNIEATSFVPPKWIPQLADSHDVMARMAPWARQRGLQLPVLVPNTRGLENAIKAGATSIEVFASATEGFSKANQNCSVEQALDMAQTVTEKALAAGLIVRGVTSCVFADPYTGPTKPLQVSYVVDRLLAMGCHEVGLGDTLGVDTPGQTRRLLDSCWSELAPISWRAISMTLTDKLWPTSASRTIWVSDHLTPVSLVWAAALTQRVHKEILRPKT